MAPVYQCDRRAAAYDTQNGLIKVTDIGHVAGESGFGAG
jgi:hypothetical protein